MGLNRRTDLHLARKAWHLSAGLTGIGVFVFSGLDRVGSLTVLAILLTFSISMEVFRLRIPRLNHAVHRCLGPILREEERHRVSGVPYFIAAAFLVVLLFPRSIAVLSLLYLTLGDPAASLVGILYGHRSSRFSNGKSLIGALAGGGVSFLVSFPVLAAFGFHSNQQWILALIGGMTAGIAEVLPLKLDDNFVIPVASALSLWFGAMFFGISVV